MCIRDRLGLAFSLDGSHAYVNYINGDGDTVVAEYPVDASGCLLYTSDAAYERSSVDLGGRRIIKKNKIYTHTQ